ncbi:CBL-interacting serine/threonine-protein kinase 10 [Camellia lanceoleosa]|uniref:CBL-interacting serine/threonine-protein kinase 10 n=1 Tax=Camellia lanceoleosa TaxID=1840588 RepID=A0ACC0H5P2_9ERIC|nr:CBL-interacting serine/threonine-protein kinase 10 [Camellia lanceoleosa]
MGLNADNSFSEDYEIVSLFGLPVFLLDELGYAIHTTFKFCAQMHNEASSYILPVVLKHEIGEDGFDLSGLFVENNQKEVQFTSAKPASAIISRLEEIARHLKLKVTKKDRGFFKLEESNECITGALSNNREIFEITPSFHVVEVKRSRGDALEYQKILKQDIRPALKEIVWAWQGEQQH